MAIHLIKRHDTILSTKEHDARLQVVTVRKKVLLRRMTESRAHRCPEVALEQPGLIVPNNGCYENTSTSHFMQNIRMNFVLFRGIYLP